MVTQLLCGLTLLLAMDCAMSMLSPCLCMSTKWVQGAHSGLEQGPREETSVCGPGIAPGSPVPGPGLPVISQFS